MTSFQSLRVLMVTRETGNERRYGLGKSLMPIVTAMRATGVSVYYICQDDLPATWRAWRERWLASMFRWPGLRGHPQRQLHLSAWTERLWMGFLAARMARKNGFSHVHLHDPWIGLGFRAAIWWYGLNTVNWGVTEHGFGSYSCATHADGWHQGPRAARLFRRLEAITLAAAHWVICPTNAAATQLARDLALPKIPDHWHVISHARPEPSTLSMKDARSRLGWSASHLYVVAMGRLVPLKNMDWVLQACATWAHKWPQLHLCILGEGDHGALRQQADALGLADRLILTTTDDVMLYLRAADLYVSASSSESFGLANLEAMCAGLPCLCTAVGGVPDVMADAAWLVPCEQQVLTSALGALLDNEELQNFWRTQAAIRALKQPDADLIAQRYVQIYAKSSGISIS